MKQYYKLIEIARALKPAHQNLRAFHVAGIFNKRGRLISIGFNTRKTHPKTIQFYPDFKYGKATHSEALAVIRAKLENFSGHYMIVVRIDNNNQVNLSSPCCHCAAFLRTLNFDNIYYSDSNGNMQKFI